MTVAVQRCQSNRFFGWVNCTRVQVWPKSVETSTCFTVRSPAHDAPRSFSSRVPAASLVPFAGDVMIERTHTVNAPWFVVDFNDQKRGRINLIRHLLQQVPFDDKPIADVKLPRLKGKPKTEHVTDKAVLVPDTF